MAWNRYTEKAVNAIHAVAVLKILSIIQLRMSNINNNDWLWKLKIK